MFRFQIINSYFVCVAVCYRKPPELLWNLESARGGERGDGLCLCGCGDQRKGIELKWEQTRNSDQSCDHLTEKRQMVAATKDTRQLAVFKGRLTDTGSSRHLQAWKDQQEGHSPGSIQDHQSIHQATRPSKMAAFNGAMQQRFKC